MERGWTPIQPIPADSICANPLDPRWSAFFSNPGNLTLGRVFSSASWPIRGPLPDLY
jgi:hypothetical protein